MLVSKANPSATNKRMVPPRAVSVLRGHKDTVNCLSFCYCNERLASGSSDGVLKVWNINSNRCVYSSAGHESSIISVFGTRDNKILSCGRDGYVKLWDLEAGYNTSSIAAAAVATIATGATGAIARQPTLSIRTQASHFCNISIDRAVDSSVANTSLVAAPGKDEKQVYLWDLRTASTSGRPVLQFEYTSGPSTISTSAGSSAGAADGHGMVTCLTIRTMTATNINSNSDSSSCSGTADINATTASNACFSSSSCVIVAGYEDGSIAQFDIRRSTPLAELLRYHSDPVLSVDIAPSPVTARKAASSSNAGVKEKAHSDRNIIHHFDEDSSVANLKCTGSVLSAGADSFIRRSILTNSVLSATKYARNVTTFSAGVAASHSLLHEQSSTTSPSFLTATNEGAVFTTVQRHVASTTATSSLYPPVSSSKEQPVVKSMLTTLLAASSPGKPDENTPRHDIVPGANQNVKTYGALPQYTFTNRDYATLTHPGTSSAQYRCDGKIFVSGHWDGTVRVWESKSMKQLAVLQHHKSTVCAVAFAVPSPSLEVASSPSPRPSRAATSTTATFMQRQEIQELAEEEYDYGNRRREGRQQANENYNSMGEDERNDADNGDDDDDDAHSHSTGTSSRSAARRPPVLFASASKDCTIALWDTFADTFKNPTAGT